METKEERSNSVFKNYSIPKVSVEYVVREYKVLGLDHIMDRASLYCALLSNYVRNSAAFVHMQTYVEIANALYDLSLSENLTEEMMEKVYSRGNSEKGIKLKDVVNQLGDNVII